MNRTRIILLTGSELRHDFVRKALGLSPGLEVVGAVCEGREKSLDTFVDDSAPGAEFQHWHLAARSSSEEDFFGPFVRLAPDQTNPVQVPKGAVNRPELCDELRRLEPDLVLAYGCSIVREPLILAFPGRFLNVHLGLSPYYRGSGTNFWPLVNGEPEFVGATFMHIDSGIDTGEVIHQVRARIHPGDTPHQIGNRLIADMVSVYAQIVRSFDQLQPRPQIPISGNGRYYRKKDFTPDSVKRLYEAFEGGLIARYLSEERERALRSPIVEHPALVVGGSL